MAKEYVQSPEVDLDKTDRLPILEGTQFDHDVEDDAVAMDHTANMLALPSAAAAGMPEFVRPSGVDLPSLAESVRSVEERIARQNADYEALSRAYEKSLEAESSLAARADALAGDLAASNPNKPGHGNWTSCWPTAPTRCSPRAHKSRRRCANRSVIKRKPVPCAMHWLRATPPLRRCCILSASVMPN
jgi:hypothetical protein